MATLHVTLPVETDSMQDDLPSPTTHHMTCFGCAFSRPVLALEYQVLKDEECSNNNERSLSEKEKVGNVKCLPAYRWRSLVNSTSMKKRISGINSNKTACSYDLRSYNLNFDK